MICYPAPGWRGIIGVRFQFIIKMTTFTFRKATLSLALVLSCGLAKAAITLDAAVPVGPQVKVGKLANGLTYYIHKNGRPAARAELRLVVKAGSIQEDDDQQGLAHFTEHMAFNGSANFKKNELISYLQSIGVKFGADLNAYTSFDETVYILPIPTDKQEYLDKSMLVLRDWAGGLTLADADIDGERGIILEEARRGKGAADRINRQLYPKLFNGSRYADRLPIGKEPILKSFKPDALRRFYADWYRPELMAVIVVGDIDPVQVEALIKTHFASLANPAKPRPRVKVDIPAFAATEALVVTDAEASANSIMIRYPVQAARERTTFRDYRRKMVENLFGNMMGARMQELAQQETPPFVGGGSGMGNLVRGYKTYMSSAILGKDGAVPAITALVQENEKARQFGFSAAELDRAKKNTLRNIERSFNERDKSESGPYAAEYIRNFLDQETIPGIENEFKYYGEFMPGITLDEINQFARENIPNATNKLVVYTGSNKAGSTIPTGPDLLAAVGKSEQAVVTAHVDRVVASQLMERPAVPGRIAQESEDKPLGLTRLTLSNGIKVILKPTTFKNDQVLMNAVRHGGQSLFDDKDHLSAQFANGIVSTMGLSKFSPLELQSMLAGNSATMFSVLGMYNESINATAGSKDIETMLQLVHLRFGGARRDDKLFHSFYGKQQELAKNAMARPESVFQDALSLTMFNNHPRTPRVPRTETLDKISLDRSIEIYNARFGSAKDFTFVVVGSFDVATIKPLLATYLGTLPTGNIVTSYRDMGLNPVAGVIKKEVRKGTEPKSIVALNFSGKAPFSELEQRRLSTLTEVMNIKINEVLREKLALIYSGSMFGRIDRVPDDQYLIGVVLPCGPANVDKVIAALNAEIAAMQKDGPSEADLNKVKQKFRQTHQKSMQENGYWLGRLQSSVLFGTDPSSILQVEQQIDGLTVEAVRNAARLYFNPANVVQLVLNPE
jgi:zinc protease